MLGFLPPLPAATPVIQYRSREGLFASVDGVPLIQGSAIQLFRASDGKGLYSSRWSDAKVTKVAGGFHVDLSAPDLSGTIDVAVAGGELTTRTRLNWEGDEPANVELTSGLLYIEPWRMAVQTPAIPRDRPARRSNEIAGRVLARGSQVRFETPRAALTVGGSPELLVFDGEGFSSEWAQNSSRYWSGYEALPIRKGAPIDVTTTYRFEGGFASGTKRATIKLAARPLANAIGPVEGRLPLIPRPQKVELDYGRPLEITGAWSFPAGRPRRFDDFRAALARRFELPPAPTSGAKVAVDGGIRDLKIIPGAYDLTITPTSITLFGQEDEGVLNAVERLAALAFVREGKIYLPSGTLRDAPRRSFRGVHLFVGPNARAFHARLWDRVLRPLGLNTVVLQAERTAWDAVPNLRGSGVMAKADLTALTKWYRSRTVEPVPLIQSFGHMEWLFTGGANRDLALNPDVLYSIDPRKPKAKELLGQIWSEAVAVTGAKTIHFGLDEVNLRGWPEDPALVTELWRLHLPFLNTIAQRHNVRPMLWGDMALAPEEAIDAANAPDREAAEARRRAIPANALIADWHYRADPKPSAFVRSLQTWRSSGLQPVASTWSRPENVRGFTLAADLERAGTLQTTWAGTESSEAGMLNAMEQFSAMVLAADYSWSARQETLDRLGYDPVEVFRRMYFDPPTPLKPTAGQALVALSGGAGAGSTAPLPEALELMRRTGVTSMPIAAPIALRTLENDAPLEIELTLGKPLSGRRLYLQSSVVARMTVGEKVARISVSLKGGKSVETDVRYGLDVVAPGDRASTSRSASVNGLSWIRIDLPLSAEILGVRLTAASAYPGFAVRAITVRP